MKKRRLKKSVYLIFLIIVALIIGMVILSKNQNKKNVEESKETVNETSTEVKEETKEKRMSLFAVGDILIHETVYKDALKSDGSYDFHHMFTEVEETIKKYDLKFCNQESTIGGKTLGISGYPSFNSPDEIGDELVN